MNKENGLPIRYAVLKLAEPKSYANNYKEIVWGYIVAKCYVMEQVVRYLINGDRKIFYKVVFPFKDLETFKLSCLKGLKDLGERQIPSYDNDFCPYPVDIVDYLFTSYDAAKEKALEENEKMRCQIVAKVPLRSIGVNVKHNLVDYMAEFDERLEFCGLFEKLALEKTEDMEIRSEIEENRRQLIK